MKKDIYQFEKTIYKGNINRDFFLYCFRQKPSILLYISEIGFFFLLRFLNLISDTTYYNHFFKFLKKFDHHKKLVQGFWEKHHRKISAWFLFQKDYRKSLILCETIDLIVVPFMKEIGVSAYICTTFNTKKNKIEGQYHTTIDLEECKKYKIRNGYIGKENYVSVFSLCQNCYLVKKDKIKLWKPRRRKVIKNCQTFFLMLFLSLGLTFVNFSFSLKVSDMKEVLPYFQQWDVFLLNYLPIVILMFFGYFLFNRLWASFGLTATLVTVLSFINKVKLIFRDEPFMFSDLTLVSESLEMTKRYSIPISQNLIIFVIALLFLTIFLGLRHKNKLKAKTRIICTVGMVVVSFFCYHKIYTNPQIYNKVGDISHINVWSNTQQFQVRGFLYPFLYSSTETSAIKPDGYSKKDAENQFSTMVDADIPNDQKVNIIAIMLEAYNDFSKLGVEFNVDIYKNFHQIEKEAYSGQIISNVFGGGTINTERSFLTGYNNFPNWRAKTNSFVWYLKSQNYYTEAMHPIYGWFYNRRNIDINLGFDNFDYYENKYSHIQEEYMSDQVFFQYIIEGYENNKKRNQPYFNFSVTYQNHGPYSEQVSTPIDYVKRDQNIPEATYNRVNNYFKGIYLTDLALKDLIDYFRKEEEPVVIILFGDHNPSLGETDQGYQALDIDLSGSTTDSFLNKYQIPYVFWANKSAKKVTGKPFKTQGETISPMFLMPELFGYFGWQGNRYMQILTDLKQHLNVVSPYFYKKGDTYTTTLADLEKNTIADFDRLQYYVITNFEK